LRYAIIIKQASKETCVMFTEYHVIQFILHCLIANIKDRSAQTAAGTVSFGTERDQITKYF
jgi:hypothetical protein